MDSAGDAYLTGWVYGGSFPCTQGAFQTTGNGNTDQDAFVAEMNPAGTVLVYGTFLGGMYADAGWGIAVDASGDAFVAGMTRSPDFPTTAGAYQTNDISGAFNAFLVKLNPGGTNLIYGTFIGSGTGSGAGTENAYSVALNSSGDAYVVGQTQLSHFPTTAGAFQTTYGGGNGDMFVTKVDATGATLDYSTYLGGSGTECQFWCAIAVDSSGEAIVSGDTSSTNFPVTSDAFNTAQQTGDGISVSKLSASGSSLVYSTYFGGDETGGVALDGLGQMYVAGLTWSTAFPVTTDAFQMTNHGDSDAFGAAFGTNLPPTPTPTDTVPPTTTPTSTATNTPTPTPQGPYIVVSPTLAMVGTALSITGTAFYTQEAVSLRFGGPLTGTLLTKPTTDKTGRFAAKANVPPCADGTYSVWALGAKSGAGGLGHGERAAEGLGHVSAEHLRHTGDRHRLRLRPVRARDHRLGQLAEHA